MHTSTADAIARRQEVASLRHALAQAQHQTERQNAELEQTKMAEKATQHTLSESMEEGLEVKRIVYDVRVYDVRVYDVWERLHEEETTNRKLTSELIQVRHTNKDNACLYKEAANTLQQAQHTDARERESDRAREQESESVRERESNRARVREREREGKRERKRENHCRSFVDMTS